MKVYILEVFNNNNDLTVHAVYRDHDFAEHVGKSLVKRDENVKKYHVQEYYLH